MADVFRDRVAVASTSTGTGSMALGAALTGYRSFASAFPDGQVWYGIINETTGEWEVGLGTLSGSGSTLARTTVYASSNANALVNFTAGAKTVYATDPALSKNLDQGTFTATVTSGVRNPLQLLRGSGAGAAPSGRLAGELWWNETDLALWIMRTSGAAYRLNPTVGWGTVGLPKLASFDGSVTTSAIWYYDNTTTGARPAGLGASDSGVGMDIVRAGSNHALRVIMDGSPQAGGILWMRQASNTGVWGSWAQVGSVMQDGTVTLPSLSFVGNLSSGFWRNSGSGEISVSHAGAEAAVFAPAGAAVSWPKHVITVEKGDARYPRIGYGSGLPDGILSKNNTQTLNTALTAAPMTTVDFLSGGITFNGTGFTLPAGSWIIRGEASLARVNAGSDNDSGNIALVATGGVILQEAGIDSNFADFSSWVTVETGVITTATPLDVVLACGKSGGGISDYRLLTRSAFGGPTKTAILKAWRVP